MISIFYDLISSSDCPTGNFLSQSATGAQAVVELPGNPGKLDQD